MHSKCFRLCTTASAAVIFCVSGAAQTSRVVQTIDNTRRTILAGHLHPKAQPVLDRGRVAPSLAITYLTITLAPSASQQADLEKLPVAQQTKGSPDYQHWLTPEEYALRFGASDADIAKVSQWLAGQGLKVLSVARARNSIAAAGESAQVEAAFQTEIHTYVVDGEMHYANGGNLATSL